METEIVNRVVELYKEKSKLFEELGNLTNTEDYRFNITYSAKTFYYVGNINYKSISESFLAEIKELTIKYIKEQIDNIDKELEQL
jgi:hypothetical protein